MKLYIKHDIHAICKKVLREQLDKLGLAYTINSFSEVELPNGTAEPALKELADCLGNYGMEIVESQKSILVQKTKDAIVEIVHDEDNMPASTMSAHLSEKLGFSYGRLSSLFSETTYTSIENFIILQKIERAKELIVAGDTTFAEIAWKLNYSSAAYFSKQFKSTTGLTPTAFQRIIHKRRELQSA